MAIKILLAKNHAIVRKGLHAMIEKESNMEVEMERYFMLRGKVEKNCCGKQ